MAQTFVFANNVDTTLADAATSTQTTLTLSSSANFPTIPTGAYWPLTLNDRATGEVYEIVYVTSYSGAVVTCIRGQEGTAANSWLVGDYVFSTNTALTTAPSQGNPATPFQTDAFTAAGLITANAGITVPSGEILTTPTIAGNPSFSGGLTVPTGETATVDGTLDVPGTLAVTGTITVPDATSGTQPVALGQFIDSLGGSGYIKFPNGFIFQWGAISNVGSGATAPFNYSIPFPTSVMAGWASVNATTGGNASIGGFGLTSATVHNNSSASADIMAFVIGY